MSESLTAEEVKGMKVAELRAALKARDLSTTGLKAELAERLTDAIAGSASTAAAGDDPSGQTSGEATEVGNDAQKGTDDLPSELPAVAPANATDSIVDQEGKEDTLEDAAGAVETSGTASEVVRPTEINTVDPVPGVVQETKAPEETMPLAVDDAEAGTKRKRDEEGSTTDMPVIPVNDSTANIVEPVAVQEEKAAEPNDSVPAAPSDVEQPEYKKPKLDAEDSEAVSSSIVDSSAVPATSSSAASSDLPPASLSAQDDIPVPAATESGAISNGIEVLPVNAAPEKTDTAGAATADLTAEEQDKLVGFSPSV